MTTMVSRVDTTRVRILGTTPVAMAILVAGEVEEVEATAEASFEVKIEINMVVEEEDMVATKARH